MEGRVLVLSYRNPLITAWTEREVRVYKVRYFEYDAGKTGKGIIHFWEHALDKSGRHADTSRPCGQYAAVDVEDIVSIR